MRYYINSFLSAINLNEWKMSGFQQSVTQDKMVETLEPITN